jgi:hypothetical protein
MGLEERVSRLEAAHGQPGTWILLVYVPNWPAGPGPDLPEPDLPDLPPGAVRWLQQDPHADPPAWDWAECAAHYPDMEIPR